MKNIDLPAFSGKLQLIICHGFLPVLFLIAGCSSSRVEQFTVFAHAGREYSQAMVALSEQAAHVAIDADSQLLLKDRDLFSSEERKEIYRQRTELLQELLSTLRDLRRHSLLLERYFINLARMATSDEKIAAMLIESMELATALDELNPGLTRAVIGTNQVADFMRQAKPLQTAGFHQRMLSRELRRHADLIDRELTLQQAVLRALAAELKSDLRITTQARAYTEVARPYIEPGRLPANWPRRRREIMSTFVVMSAVDNAADAAGELQTAFRDLVENRVDSADWSRLFGKINAMFDLLETATSGG